MKEKTKSESGNKYIIGALSLIIIFAFVLVTDFGELFTDKTPRGEQDIKAEKSDNDDIDTDLEDYLLDEVDEEIIASVRIEKIKYYRKLLLNLSLLERKFLEGENFNKELQFLLTKSESYPKQVANYLIDLKEYQAKYMQSNIKQYQQLEFGDGFFKDILGRIFNIKKENPLYNDMQKEFTELKKKIYLLENYFYSMGFLKERLKYD